MSIKLYVNLIKGLTSNDIFKTEYKTKSKKNINYILNNELLLHHLKLDKYININMVNYNKKLLKFIGIDISEYTTENVKNSNLDIFCDDDE